MKGNTRYFTALVIFIFALALNASAQTVPITITSYEIKSTPRSGFGCWYHTYFGYSINVGRTLNRYGGYCNFDGNQLANYITGIGTLNDGIISDTSNTHLFTIGLADDGLPILPEITLHLNGMFIIDKINVFGGTVEYNAAPGALTSATVEIGGVAVVDLPITPIGSANALGIFPNGEFDLVGTVLAQRPTNQIVLKNFAGMLFGAPFDQFSITEITVEGSLPPVPMPVGIDIRPGNQRNKIELGEDDRVKVAVLASTTFDAPASVDRTSLTFGKTGDERSLAFCDPSPRDVNADGLLDLICGFKITKMGFQLGDTTGVLKGKTLSGTAIRGEDAVSISSM